MISKFILNSFNTGRTVFLWNMAGSMFMAFQSVIMLMILTRTEGLEMAGVFSMSYANATLFLTIGKYGMRNFQVSDSRHQYSFGEFMLSRKITVLLMLAVSLWYTAYASLVNEYSDKKCVIILLTCVFKAADAVEDVYTARYQQENRMDIGAKIMALRSLVSVIVFGICLVLGCGIILSLLITAVAAYILLFFLVRTANTLFVREEVNADFSRAGILLKNCFPLFLNTFLIFYIGNAPKYAIDKMLSDELQACYGFISLPVFVIGLLNGFIFNPLIYQMSQLWKAQKIQEFLRYLGRQICIIAVLTALCMAGVWLFGVFVLSILYHTELGAFRLELLILMLGGGLLGLSGILTTVITIMRRQKSLIWTYTATAFAAVLLSDRIVEYAQIMGAALLYTLLMGILCIFLGCVLVAGIRKEIR